jgi:hypothetical protein
MGFMKTGAAAKALLQEETAKAEAAQAERGKLWRFRIPEQKCGEDFTVSFLDGILDEDGALSAPMWMEHTIYLAGRWQNVPCTSHEEPCPICANTDSKSALVAGFTVIDHTPYKILKGPNAGQMVKDQRRLFIAKKSTFAILQKLASKQGGLIGCTFEVSRQNDKSPSVGDLFQFLEKRKLSQLASIYGDAATPADFGEEITYYSAQQLIGMGVKGTAMGKIGGEGNSSDLDNELGMAG